MNEKDLIDIERRMNLHPLEARNDIAQLIGELRRLRQVPTAKATHASHLYDPLTGLLNAGAYGVRFAMARARATRYRKLFAVMSLDLDAAVDGPDGSRDTTVKDVAQRLERCVRATDTLARIGQENFAIILEDLSQPDQAERVKQQIEEALSERSAAPESAPRVDIRLQFYPGAQQASEHRLSS